ncbi:MAG: hypothetical protein IH991_25120, partial [Planctomycetes bacterium]|nr:hypothetical protein [Planctomycetota bacterium]
MLRDPLFRATSLIESQADVPSDLVSRADYMAPELSQQGQSPDLLTDIYALGCTFYHLLSGRPPFAGEDVMQKLARHASEPIQPLEQFGVPQQIGQLVTYMMAKNPSVRYQQAAVVAEQLTPFVNPVQLQIQAPAPPQSLSSYEQWTRQKGSTLARQAATEKAKPSSFSGVVVETDSNGSTAMPGAIHSATGATPVTSAAQSKPSTADQLQPKSISKKNQIVLWSSLGGGLAALLLIIIVAANSGGGRQTADGKKDKDNAKDESGVVVPPTDNDPERDQQSKDSGTSPKIDVSNGPAPAFIQDIVDDEKAPWASPTNGPPITLEYVPPNPGIIIIARPIDLLASDEGKKVIKALGPVFEEARNKWEEELSVPLDRIEQVFISFHPEEGAAPRPAFVVKLAEAIPEQTLLANWKNPKSIPVPEAETNFYEAASGWAFYLPREDPNEPVKLIVMGKTEDIRGSVINSKDGPQEPLMRMQMKQVLRWSDATRHFTCVFEPSAVLLGSGQKLLSGRYSKIREALDWILGDGIQSAMVSLHVDDAFYVEMRVKAAAGTVQDLPEHFRGRLADLFKKTSAYIADMGSSPYWERLRMNYPMQVKSFKDYARVGIEDGQALLNCYMPLHAAHNLIAGTELAIAAPTGAGGIKPPPSQPVVKTLEELLQQKIDLVDIPQQDLVFAVRDVKNEILDTYRNL